MSEIIQYIFGVTPEQASATYTVMLACGALVTVGLIGGLIARNKRGEQ